MNDERLKLLAAWSVHLYTATGTVICFIALWSAFQADFRATFALLAAALFIDVTDGTLARKFEVKKYIPWFDGGLLDNIVDYLSYVVVPVAVFVQPGLIPDGWWWVAFLPLLASSYQFCRTDAKGVEDHYFRGFPSYWNVMAFYFVVIGTPAAVNVILLLAASVGVFVPMRWLYLSRTHAEKRAAIMLGVVWAMIGAVMIYRLPEKSVVLGTISLFYPVYYFGASLGYHLKSTGNMADTPTRDSKLFSINKKDKDAG